VRGSIESQVDQIGRLDVEMENSDATAHSAGGHFFVTADGVDGGGRLRHRRRERVGRRQSPSR